MAACNQKQDKKDLKTHELQENIALSGIKITLRYICRAKHRWASVGQRRRSAE
jgi:hypothetical protein